MREVQEQPPTAEELNEALKQITQIDLFHDLPDQVAGENDEYFADSLTLRDALHVVYLHLQAQRVQVVPPPMANFGRSAGLMRGRNH